MQNCRRLRVELALAGAILLVAQCGCGRKDSYEVRTVRNPLTQSEAPMRLTHLGNVGLMTVDSDKPGLVVLTVDGKLLVVLDLHARERHVEIYGAAAGPTVGSNEIPLVSAELQSESGMGTKISYAGNTWQLWDMNFDGQPDMRQNRATQVVEIWMGGMWRERQIEASSDRRRDVVDGKEVVFGTNGWEFVGR